MITSAVLKLYSSGMTDEEMRLAIGSIYEARYSRLAISAITDAVVEDVYSIAIHEEKLDSIHVNSVAVYYTF